MSYIILLTRLIEGDSVTYTTKQKMGKQNSVKYCFGKN